MSGLSGLLQGDAGFGVCASHEVSQITVHFETVGMSVPCGRHTDIGGDSPSFVSSATT